MKIEQDVMRVTSSVNHDYIKDFYHSLLNSGEFPKMERMVSEMARKNRSHELILDLLTIYSPKRYYVYNLVREGEVVYVGCSEKPVTRLAAHRKDKEFDDVRIAECADKATMLLFEGSEIYNLKPEYNKVCKIVDNDDINGVKEYLSLPDHLESRVIIGSEEIIALNKFKVNTNLMVMTEMKRKSDKKKKRAFAKSTFVRVKWNKRAFTGWSGHEDIRKSPSKKSENNDKSFDMSNIKHLQISNGIYQIGDIVFTGNDKWRYSWSNKWFVRDTAKTVETATERLAEKESGDHTSAIWFGKHKGKTMDEVYQTDKLYILWMAGNLQKDALERLCVDEYVEKFKKESMLNA